MIFKNMILQYLINVMTSLKLIHAGTVIVKIKSSMKLGIMISPFAFLIDKLTEWGMGNGEYISFVLIAIAIDHVLGTLKHLSLMQFSIKKNIVGLMTKIGLVVACGMLFEGLNAIITHETLIKDYLTIVTRLIVFLYPAGSAFGNSTFLSGGKFPPQSWLDKLKSFQTNLDPKGFQEKNKHHQEDEFTD